MARSHPSQGVAGVTVPISSTFDPAMIERIRLQGVQSVVPVIIYITPMTPAEIRPLLGLAPAREEEHPQLAGVYAKS